MRCSPCVDHESLAKFDDILRKGLNSIVNMHLTDDQWLQASLPVKDGGLGVRRVSSLAPSAFLASAASTRALQESLLMDCNLVQLRVIYRNLRVIYGKITHAFLHNKTQYKA